MVTLLDLFDKKDNVLEVLSTMLFFVLTIFNNILHLL